MSTSLLYHAFGIRGYRYVKTEYERGGVVFTITQDRERLRCSECGCAEVILRGSTERRFRAPPVGRKPVTIVFSVPRVECHACGLVRQVKLSFAETRRRHTRSFERYVLELSKLMTILDVARHLGVGWDLVKDIQKRYLMRRFAKPRLKDLRLIAMDEISVRKSRRFMTVILDLETGAVVGAVEGRSSKALEPLLRRLRRSRAKVAAVATDFYAAYVKAVTTHLPEACLVFDRFHVLRLFNEKLSDLRNALHRKAVGRARKALVGTRWLLLKNPENLDQERHERERLEEALLLNRPLATAYYLKEDLRHLWEQENKETAAAFLDDWILRAKASGMRRIETFARTLTTHRAGLLAWYDYPISTGPLEGTQAYGFRDLEFFKLRMFALHEMRQVLVG
jgi:transposase